jgi:tetratricopeptide (TPR) repeat protein
MGVAPEKRLDLLEKNQEVVAQRDDSLSHMIELKVLMGKCDDAIKLMTGRQFEVWEGGTLSVADSWIDAHLLRGRQEVIAGKYQEALADFQAAHEMPENLPSERSGLSGRDPEISYWTGEALEGLRDPQGAKNAWTLAAAIPAGQDRFPGRGDAQPYWQGLSLRKLGDEQKATEIFQQLVKNGTDQLQARAESDLPASFGRQQSPQSRTANAHYVLGLGYLGLNQKEKAKEQFTDALASRPSHLGARIERTMLN